MIGAKLVKEFLAEHGTDMQRLFNRSTHPRRASLRAKLIRQLDAAGLNRSEISRVLDIDRNTVVYWLEDEFRRKKLRARAANHQRNRRNKIYNWWEQCAQAMEARA